MEDDEKQKRVCREVKQRFSGTTQGNKTGQVGLVQIIDNCTEPIPAFCQ